MTATLRDRDSRTLPVLFLKTRSQPTDGYDEHFSNTQVPSGTSAYSFDPSFVPVLEHTQNSKALSELSRLLRDGELKRKYGGMVFTSQRAVEAWIDVVQQVERDHRTSGPSRQFCSSSSDPFANFELLTPFPLYVVGPATERALATLISDSSKVPSSPFHRINPSTHGAESGNGANLAAFILEHYNRLHQEHWFTYFEAPRLPFIPLLGMSSQNYGRKRLERDDERLRKKPLCFLVGETRRDVIPRTLHDAEDKIVVEEVEVYGTEVVKSFEHDLESMSLKLDTSHPERPRVVVVFSPQGSDVLLRHLGYLDGSNNPIEAAKPKWWQNSPSINPKQKWIVATIGPTTRDYLKDKFSFEADVCAEKPSPEGLTRSIAAFLVQMKIDT